MRYDGIMKPIEFVKMDSGRMREFLTAQYAEWADAGLMSSAWVRVFYRRVGILAHRVGISRTELMGVIENEASK